MLPEVQKYAEAIHDAREYWESGRYDKPYDDALAEYKKRLQEARKLIANSNNSLVQWVAKNDRLSSAGSGYMFEALEILKLLPANFKTLNDYAKKEARWCETWEEFVDAAISDGLLKLEWTYEYKYNAGNWRRFSPVYGHNSQPIMTTEAIQKFAEQGVSEVTMTLNGDFYTYRATQEISFV